MDDHEMELFAELDRWRGAGKVARFWLRDDDAIEPTAALDRLLGLANEHGIPVTLAVIPAHTGAPLAGRVRDEPLFSVAVHGWSHANHARQGEKKQELGGHRPAADVIAELRQGRLLLSELHDERFVPLLVPPWNRIDGQLLPYLTGCGFAALSVFGPEKEMGLPVVNTHVDVMDWHGTRGGRASAELFAEIIGRLRVMFETGGTMGLLTHHLVHDEAVWAFLARLFTLTRRHPACEWSAVSELMA